MSRFKNKFLIILYIVLFIVCCSTIVNAGDILDNSYDEGGKQNMVTEYDFAVKAAEKPSRWYGLNSSKLIGNYVYMNLGNVKGGEGKATINMSHAFCLGHGNSQSTPISQNNRTWLYRLETIWDIDMDDNDLPRNIYYL